MESITTQVINLSAFYWTCGILATIILALIGFIVKYIIEGQKNQITVLFNGQDKLNKEVIEVKDNYLSRFEKTYKLIGESKEELKTEISNLSLKIVALQSTMGA